ncbi:FUSC family protein [Paraburkholderia sp. 22B1P]|uniref:FUSC family protein n=1 Tax=Paraburkholderia sp. 22B1P TaxID=3080498 RepID=UPI0030913260|nr:FUSC family protein [Paraburkholderia sp. 22B1P]
MIADLRGLYEEFVVYRNEDAPRLLHAFKAALAVVLSMLISMRLELRSPGTAMVSAVIVMLQQQSGMVIARGFYRTLGIICGSLAGLTLVGMFAQQPPLFLGGLAIWVGLFVAGSSYYKNYQSYGFVLSGYAACITTVPEWATPYDVVDNVIYTISEVMIGVATGGLISALIFPQKVVPALMKWRETALASLLSALRSAASGETSDEPVESYLKLIRESVAIEGLRTAAVFEDPAMRLRNDALVLLDETFLDAVTRIYAVNRARQITKDIDHDVKAETDALFDKLVTLAADVEEGGLQTMQRVDRLNNQLGVLEAWLRAHECSSTCGRQYSDAGARIVEMVGAEVYLAVSSLHDFCGACSIVFNPPKIQLTQPIVQAIAFMRSAPLRSSGITAIVSGLRAAISVSIVAAAWIASGWTNGYIAVVSAGITSGFFSLNPTPIPASWQNFTGCLFACMAGFILNFVVMPGLGDVTLLALCIGTVIFFGSYANTFPSIAGLGAGFNVYFCYALTPMNVAVYNPPAYLDRSFALLIGIGASAAAFSLVIPREGQWLARQTAARIRDILVHAATDDVDAEEPASVGVAMRDLIVRIVTVPNVSKAYRARTTTWAFGQLWIANTLSQLRRLADAHADALPPAWSDVQGEWLKAIGQLAQSGKTDAAEAAYRATERALQVLRTHSRQLSSEKAEALFEMRARLYSTRAALTDQLPVASAVKATAS